MFYLAIDQHAQQITAHEAAVWPQFSPYNQKSKIKNQSCFAHSK